MRILSLNPHFDQVSPWREQTTAITRLVPGWYNQPFLRRVRSLLRMANRFDVIVFYQDVRLAAVVGLLRRVAGVRPRLILQELFCDISRYRAGGSLWARARITASLVLHRVLVRAMDAIVVHTSGEIALYARFFGVPPARFRFIPYFVYEQAIPAPADEEPAGAAGGYVLAIGRHRDFGCFVEALRDMPWRGVIVAGETDRAAIGATLPANIAAHYEVPWATYRRFIAEATVVVIPLFADRWQRALGQIALLEAMMLRRPIVAARTFQLTDYAGEDQVLYYDPGDAADLRRQVGRLLADGALRRHLTTNAAHLQTHFTQAHYLCRLLETCREVGSV